MLSASRRVGAALLPRSLTAAHALFFSSSAPPASASETAAAVAAAFSPDEFRPFAVTAKVQLNHNVAVYRFDFETPETPSGLFVVRACAPAPRARARVCVAFVGTHGVMPALVEGGQTPLRLLHRAPLVPSRRKFVRVLVAR